MHRFFFLLLLTWVPSIGCATPLPSSRVASDHAAAASVRVLAPLLETPVELDVTTLAAALTEGLSANGGLVAVADEPAIVVEPSCVERLACLRALGRESASDFVVATVVTGLGDTAMIRVRLVDVAETGSEQSRQTVVEPAHEAALAEALHAIGVALSASFAPEDVDRAARDRRRARWRWLGPVLGTVLLAGAGVTYLVARPEPEEPDVVISPP